MSANLARQNVTLSLPKPLLKKIRVLAAQKETSVSGLVVRLLSEQVEKEDAYAQARNRFMEIMKKPRNLGTHGKTTWTRDELHER